MLLNTNEYYDHIQPCLNSSGGDDVFSGENAQEVEEEEEEELTSLAVGSFGAAVSSSIQWTIDWSQRSRDYCERSPSIDSVLCCVKN